jgi:hypothetical protein
MTTLVQFINSTNKECGVYQYGLRLYNILKKSKRVQYLYSELNNLNEYNLVVDAAFKSGVSTFIYNYCPPTLPWLNSTTIQKRVVNIGIYHENYTSFFDYECYNDPLYNESANKFSLPRPIYEDVDLIIRGYKPSCEIVKSFIYEGVEDKTNTTVFGSFGFAFYNKGFVNLVKLVNEKYESAIIKIVIPYGTYVPDQQSTLLNIIQQCKNANVKKGIKLMFCHEFFSNEDLLLFLSLNSINAFLYDSSNREPASVIDYAISVKKPLLLSHSNRFRHLCSDGALPSCLTDIDECSLSSVKYLEKFREMYSHENTIAKFDSIVFHDFKPLSQAGQDLFVYKILNHVHNGTYMDIGTADCTEWGSNTLQLSKRGWRGIGFDIGLHYRNVWTINRKDQPFVLADLTKVNWDSIIKENTFLENVIDYISFDIDDATKEALKIFPFDRIRFKVMTIEHDSYRVGNELKYFIRELLSKHGYELLCCDVSCHYLNQDCIYEDWFIDPTHIDWKVAQKFRSEKRLGLDLVI